MEVHGHRGCRGLLPENTIAAFKKAIALGVDAIEMDVAVTKENQIIVSHEPFISRKICLDPTGYEIPLKEDMQHNLYMMTYEDIKRFDCGLKQHPDFPHQLKIPAYKPLLSEVVEVCDALNPKIKYNIEIKAKPSYDKVYTPSPKEFVQILIKTLEHYKITDRANLQSFDLRILEEIKQQSKLIKVALLIDKDEQIETKLNALSYTPEIMSPYFKLLNLKNVRGLQSKNFKIIPWTVNKIDDLKAMINLGVDGIITDYPDRLIRLL